MARKIAVLAVAFMLLLAGQATGGGFGPPTYTVKIKRDRFKPKSLTLGGPGAFVQWNNRDRRKHKIQFLPEPIGNSLVAPKKAISERLVFNVASTYPYKCKKHREKGSIGVPMYVADLDYVKSFGDNFDFVWSQIPIPSGWNIDVHVSPNGGATWLEFLMNVTSPGVNDVQADNIGTFLYSARIQHTATGYAFEWSPPMSVTVI